MNGTVISLGGSIFSKEGEKHLLQFITRMKKKESYAIVVGGGPIARERIKMISNVNSREYYLDKMGIQATRLNAMTVSLAMGNLMDVPRSIDDAVLQMEIYHKVVMGGTEPGHSTDAVTALLSEALGRDTVINVTDVDALYDRDPKLPKAKKITSLSFEQAIDMITSKTRGAGTNFPLDLLSLNIARRSSIKIKIVSFRDLDNVFRALEGKKFLGTTVSKN